MSTCSNVKIYPITILDAFNEWQRWKIEHKPPPSSYRLHPDDYSELKRQSDENLPHPMPDVPTHLDGRRIVVDAGAPRIPRRENRW